MHLKKYGQMIVMFSSFCLIFSLTTMLTYARSTDFYGRDSIAFFYSLELVATAFGFACISPVIRWLQQEENQKQRLYLFVCVLGVLYTTGMLLLLFSGSKQVYFVIGLMLPFLFGHLGGLAHYTAARVLFQSEHIGKTLGMAYSIAVVIQYAMQKFLTFRVLQGLLLIVANVIVLTIITKKLKQGLTFERKQNKEIEKVYVRKMLVSMHTSYLLSHMIYIFSMGFYAVFMIVSFVSDAGYSAHPALYASMGRIVYTLSMAVTTIQADTFSSMEPMKLYLIAGILFLLTFLIFVFSGKLSLMEKGLRRKVFQQRKTGRNCWSWQL